MLLASSPRAGPIVLYLKSSKRLEKYVAHTMRNISTEKKEQIFRSGAKGAYERR